VEASRGEIRFTITPGDRGCCRDGNCIECIELFRIIAFPLYLSARLDGFSLRTRSGYCILYRASNSDINLSNDKPYGAIYTELSVAAVRVTAAINLNFITARRAEREEEAVPIPASGAMR